MEKPCETDTFVKLVCEQFVDDYDYDDYRITNAIISWNNGDYISAFIDFPINLAQELLGNSIILIPRTKTIFNNEGISEIPINGWMVQE